METNEKKSEKQPDAAPKKRLHLARWQKILAAVLAVIVLLAVLVLGTEKKYKVSPAPSDEELREYYIKKGKNAIDTLLESAGTSCDRLQESPFTEGRKLLGNLPSMMDRPIRIEFSGEELNGLLMLGIREYEKQREPEEPVVNAEWKKGVFYVSASYPIGLGLATNFYCGAVPELIDGNPHLRLTECWVGNLPVPCAWVQERLDREVAKEMADSGELAIALMFLKKIENDAENGITLELMIDSSQETADRLTQGVRKMIEKNAEKTKSSKRPKRKQKGGK